MTRDQCAECGYEHFKHAIVCSRGLNPADRPVDHGISPAQLREKVEALEAKYQGINESIDDLEKRFLAALRRIEQLERDRAVFK